MQRNATKLGLRSMRGGIAFANENIAMVVSLPYSSSSSVMLLNVFCLDAVTRVAEPFSLLRLL